MVGAGTGWGWRKKDFSSLFLFIVAFSLSSLQSELFHDGSFLLTAALAHALSRRLSVLLETATGSGIAAIPSCMTTSLKSVLCLHMKYLLQMLQVFLETYTGSAEKYLKLVTFQRCGTMLHSI